MADVFRASNPDYEKAVRDSFARQGLMTTLGARIVTLEPGFCVVEMPYAPGVSQQQGFFHGGAVGAIADTAAGYAAYSLMPAGSEILTVEYKLNLGTRSGAADAEGRRPRSAGRQDPDGMSRRCLSSGRQRHRAVRAVAVDADAGGKHGVRDGASGAADNKRLPQDRLPNLKDKHGGYGAGLITANRRSLYALLRNTTTNALSGKDTISAPTTRVIIVD